MFRGLTTDYNSRANLPSPVTNGFNGPATVRGQPIAKMTALPRLEICTTLSPREPTRSHRVPISTRHLIDKFTLAGVSHPLVGYAGRVRHTAQNHEAAADTSTYRVVWGEPGVAVTAETNADSNITTIPWPGSPIGGSGTGRVEQRSTQQVIIYKSNAEDATAAGGPGLGGIANALQDAKEAFNNSGNSVFFKIGDTVYYPGLLTNLQYYDAGDSNFQEHDGTTSTRHNSNTEGALLLTFSPGFNFVPPKFDMSEKVSTDLVQLVHSMSLVSRHLFKKSM